MRILPFVFVLVTIGRLVAADVYVAQTATGSGSGADAKNCKAISKAGWTNGATNHLTGTISSSITITGPGTLFFEPDAKMSADHWSGQAIKVSADGVVIDGGENGLIEATGQNSISGVSSNGVAIYQHSNLEVKNLTIRNMYKKTEKSDLAHAAGTAIDLKYGNNFHVHHCVLQGQGCGVFYTYTAGASSSDVELDHNTISDGNWGIGSGSGGENAVHDKYLIHDNDISMPGEIWDDPHNDNHHNGIYTWAAQPGSKITGLKIYNNYVHGDAGAHSTAFIYVSANESGQVSHGMEGVLVYNNLINMTTHGASNGGIFVSCNGFGVYNNTIVASGVEGGLGIRQYCGDVPGTEGAIRNNIVFNFITTIYGKGTGGVANLTQDHNLENVDPKFVDGKNDFHLTKNSPAVGKGVDLSKFFKDDLEGVIRTVPWDQGCYALSGSAPVPTPTPPVEPTPVPTPSATPRPSATPTPPPASSDWEKWIERQSEWDRANPPD